VLTVSSGILSSSSTLKAPLVLVLEQRRRASAPPDERVVLLAIFRIHSSIWRDLGLEGAVHLEVVVETLVDRGPIASLAFGRA